MSRYRNIEFRRRPTQHQAYFDEIAGMIRQGLTLREIAKRYNRNKATFCGTVKQVADHMEHWMEAGACDGFMISFVALPSTLCRFRRARWCRSCSAAASSATTTQAARCGNIWACRVRKIATSHPAHAPGREARLSLRPCERNERQARWLRSLLSDSPSGQGVASSSSIRCGWRCPASDSWRCF